MPVYLTHKFTDKFTCCHTDIEIAYQTFYLTQSQCNDTGPTSPSVDPITLKGGGGEEGRGGVNGRC